LALSIALSFSSKNRSILQESWSVSKVTKMGANTAELGMVLTVLGMAAERVASRVPQVLMDLRQVEESHFFQCLRVLKTP
jgi:hypothetical protein